MEYLLADAGYMLNDYICTPYRHPLDAVPRNQLFNVWYSSGRVTIEHVNGGIKSRFGSLKGIRILEEEREVAVVAVTGNVYRRLRQRVQAELLHWVQNNMLL